MRQCPNCNQTFNIKDAIKSTNPARMKCGNCGEEIASSYVFVVIGLIIFLGIYITARATFLAGYGMIEKIAFLLVVALVFEVAYYFLLAKGIIKSNLVKP